MVIGDEDEVVVDKIVDLASGTHFTLFVTESGKLYGSGNRFLKEIGLESDNKIINIPLPEGFKVLKAFASQSKKQPVAIIKV
jgi:alpha-tubulin suppressor-like RCC1 family protein